MSYWRSFRSRRPQNVTPLTHLDALFRAEVARIEGRAGKLHIVTFSTLLCALGLPVIDAPLDCIKSYRLHLSLSALRLYIALPNGFK